MKFNQLGFQAYLQDGYKTWLLWSIRKVLGTDGVFRPNR